MTKDEIRSMFRLAAAARRMPDCDPRKETAAMALEGATEQYRAEVLDPANSPDRDRENESVNWVEALRYVAALFGKMDEDESEPDHEKMCGFRRTVWENIANGVQNWYQSPAAKKPAGEDRVFNPVH